MEAIVWYLLVNDANEMYVNPCCMYHEIVLPQARTFLSDLRPDQEMLHGDELDSLAHHSSLFRAGRGCQDDSVKGITYFKISWRMWRS